MSIPLHGPRLRPCRKKTGLRSHASTTALRMLRSAMTTISLRLISHSVSSDLLSQKRRSLTCCNNSVFPFPSIHTVADRPTRNSWSSRWWHHDNRDCYPNPLRWGCTTFWGTDAGAAAYLYGGTYTNQCCLRSSKECLRLYVTMGFDVSTNHPVFRC